MSDREPLAPAPARMGQPAASPWDVLRRLTPARVALGRSGAALPSAEVLAFGHAHALARDAVHRTLDTARLKAEIHALGLHVYEVASAAPDRATYLRRPDLGRQLAPESAETLQDSGTEAADLAIIVADGLSAIAVQANAPPLLAALLPGIRAAGWRLAPIVIATQARVALGDQVGAALHAGMALVLIGERPGLSSPDSLGAYLTFAPQAGRRDNERNCVSNIRVAGLSADRAAGSLLWLMAEAFRRGSSGVALKDESLRHVPLPDVGTDRTS
jgi:ethanolamine ammonia-lyase small subunit